MNFTKEEIHFLYEKHKDDLFRYFVKLTRDEDFAYDIVQSIFLNLIHDLQRKKRDSIHFRFLLEIGYNIFLNEIKKKKRAVEREKKFYSQNFQEKSVEYNLNQSSKEDLAKIIQEEISLLNLHERVKASLMMRLFHEEKIEKIAQFHGVSKRTVLRDLELGLGELKKVLIQKGIYKDA